MCCGEQAEVEPAGLRRDFFFLRGDGKRRNNQPMKWPPTCKFEFRAYLVGHSFLVQVCRGLAAGGRPRNA